MKKQLFMMAAAVCASAALTSCSSDLQEVTQTLEAPKDAPAVTYTVNIAATKASDDVTRALTEDGTSLNATWGSGEKVYVYKGTTSVGTLEPKTTGSATATLTGELKISGGFAVNDVLTLYYLKDKSNHEAATRYASQLGTVANIGANYDYATATVKVTKAGAAGDFEEGDNILETEAATGEKAFKHNQAVTKFSFTFKGTAVNVSPLVITSTNLVGSPLTVTPATATSDIWVAMKNSETTEQSYSFNATVGGVVYHATKSVALADGNYYYATIPLIKAASNLTVTIPAQTYTGSQLTPVVTVTDGETGLTENTDYTVTLPEGRTNAGDYTVTVTGNGAYDATTTQTFTINKATTNAVAFGNTATITLTLGGTTTATRPATATWGTPTYSSSNEAVATVNASGVITAVAPGVTTISASVAETANYNGCSTPTNITVYVKQEGISGGIDQPGTKTDW